MKRHLTETSSCLFGTHHRTIVRARVATATSIKRLVQRRIQATAYSSRYWLRTATAAASLSDVSESSDRDRDRRIPSLQSERRQDLSSLRLVTSLDLWIVPPPGSAKSVLIYHEAILGSYRIQGESVRWVWTSGRALKK